MSGQTREPHYQLKAIRNTLEKTQKEFAKMLRVSYPYLLSVETGWRPMSEALAQKVSWVVGVSTTELLKSKKAKPMSFDDTAQGLVPFSLETYRQHRAQFPKFSISPHDEEVTPTLEGYAKVFHAVLDSAMSRHRLRQVMPNFFKFLADSIGPNWGLLIDSVQRLYPDDREAREAMIAAIGRGYLPQPPDDIGTTQKFEAVSV